MEEERQEQDFEREENERLMAAFERFDSLYNKSKEPDRRFMPEQKPQLSQNTDFEEDEYEFIVDRYIDLFNDPMARLASQMGFEAYPYSSAMLVKYCDSLIVSREFGRTLMILDKYKDSFPPNADIYLSYSRVYIGMKDLGNARRYYNLAIQAESTPEEVCDSVHTLAQDCIDIEDYKEALFYLDRAAELTATWNRKHNQTEKSENLASYYFDYAFCTEKLGNDEKALEIYQKCLDIDPFNDFVWHNIGMIYVRKNLYRKAYEAYDYAVALNPQNTSALFNLGHLCIECNMYDQALHNFEECCKIEKDNPDSITALALAYFLKGDLNQAEILYRKALIFCPDHEGAKAGLKDVQAEKQLRSKIGMHTGKENLKTDNTDE